MILLNIQLLVHNVISYAFRPVLDHLQGRYSYKARNSIVKE